MNGNMKKVSYLFLLGCFFLYFLGGCSTPKNFLSRLIFGESSNIKQDIDKEIAQFASNVRPSPGNPDSHYLLATYYLERGRHNEAIVEFKKVLLIDPNHVKAYNGLGVTYDLLKDFSRAIAFYKKALELSPKVDYVQNNLGYSYLLQGNLDGAIAAFKNAIALNDQEKKFHNNLGLAYAEKGQIEMALAEFKLAGDEAKAHYNIAQFFYKKGLYNVAKIHFATASSLNSSFTISRTKFEAASALDRIFQPTTASTEVKESIIPDQLQIEKAKIEKPMVMSQSKSDIEISKPQNNLWTGETPVLPSLVMSDQMVVMKKEVVKEAIDNSNGNGAKQWTGETLSLPLSGMTDQGIIVKKVVVKEVIPAKPMIENIHAKAVVIPDKPIIEKVKTEKPITLNQQNEIERLISLKEATIEILNGNGTKRGTCETPVLPPLGMSDQAIVVKKEVGIIPDRPTQPIRENTKPEVLVTYDKTYHETLKQPVKQVQGMVQVDEIDIEIVRLHLYKTRPSEPIQVKIVELEPINQRAKIETLIAQKIDLSPLEGEGLGGGQFPPPRRDSWENIRPSAIALNQSTPAKKEVEKEAIDNSNGNGAKQATGEMLSLPSFIIPDQWNRENIKIEAPIITAKPIPINQRVEIEYLNYGENKYLKFYNPPLMKDGDNKFSSFVDVAPSLLDSLKEATIEISNGNGAYRMARRVGDYLKEKGLKVIRLTNAKNFKHSDTKIFYQKGYHGAADQVAERLPVIQGIEEIKEFDRPNIRIKVVIGKDLIQHDQVFRKSPKYEIASLHP